MQVFGGRGRDHLRDIGVDGRIIIKRILKEIIWSVVWIYVA
jgi:hypothetical protein